MSIAAGWKLYEYNCKSCGKHFQTYKWRERTCCMACRINWDSKKEKVYNHKYYLKRKAENSVVLNKICIVCSKPFQVTMGENDAICQRCRLAGKTMHDRDLNAIQEYYD